MNYDQYTEKYDYLIAKCKALGLTGVKRSFWRLTVYNRVAYRAVQIKTLRGIVKTLKSWQ